MVTSSPAAGMRVAPYFGIYSIVVKTLPQLIEDMEAFALIKMRQLGLKPVSYTHLDVYKRQTSRTALMKHTKQLLIFPKN